MVIVIRIYKWKEEIFQIIASSVPATVTLFCLNVRSPMAKWLEQASQWHERYCHNLEVMSSNPSWVELGVLGISVLSRTWTKNILFLNPKYKNDGTNRQNTLIQIINAPNQSAIGLFISCVWYNFCIFLYFFLFCISWFQDENDDSNQTEHINGKKKGSKSKLDFKIDIVIRQHNSHGDGWVDRFNLWENREHKIWAKSDTKYG